MDKIIAVFLALLLMNGAAPTVTNEQIDTEPESTVQHHNNDEADSLDIYSIAEASFRKESLSLFENNRETIEKIKDIALTISEESGKYVRIHQKEVPVLSDEIVVFLPDYIDKKDELLDDDQKDLITDFVLDINSGSDTQMYVLGYPDMGMVTFNFFNFNGAGFGIAWSRGEIPEDFGYHEKIEGADGWYYYRTLYGT